MGGTVIQPKYFRVNGAGEATLVIYDYRLQEGGPNQKFDVLLNGERLSSCNTKDGFLLRVFLPLETYRVSLQLGRGRQAAMVTEVLIDRRGEYGLPVLVAPDGLTFGEVGFYLTPPTDSPHPTYRPPESHSMLATHLYFDLVDENVDDKLFVYREAFFQFSEINSYIDISKLYNMHISAQIDTMLFSDKGRRGARVHVILPGLPLRKNLTEVTVGFSVRDVEHDRAQGKAPSAKRVQAEGTLPPVPADFQASTGLSPQEREARLSANFAAVLQDDPERAARLAYEMVRAAEEALPPDQRHNLGLREAARRISSRGISIDHKQLGQFFKQGRLKIGVAGPDGEPRFSPAECDSFVRPTRLKPGPKTDETE